MGSDWHFVEWNPEKVARFHGWIAHCAARDSLCFSKQVGAGIVRFLQYLMPVGGAVLDYGFGKGHLLEQFLAAGIACQGVDIAADYVESANTRFAGNPLWGGAHRYEGHTLPFPDDSFDLITCLETIEHVLPDDLPSVLYELRRVLKPHTGRLFVTVPFDEVLERSMVCCPECGTVFHSFQHLRSFTVSSLAGLMSEHAFATLLCDRTNFWVFQDLAAGGSLTSPVQQGIEDERKTIFRRANRWFQERVGRRVAAGPRPASSAEMNSVLLEQELGKGPHLFWFGHK